jgi:outer membrane protein TolC
MKVQNLQPLFVLFFIVFIFLPFSPWAQEPAADLQTQGSSEAALSLDEAVDAAYDYSGQLTVKNLELREKEYALDEAKARRLPTVELQASATLMSNPQEGIIIRKGELGYQPSFQSEAPVPFPDQDYILMEDYEHTYFKVETTVDQPIFTWGKLKRGVELARGDVRSAAVRRNITEGEVKKQVRQAYFGILFTRQALAKVREALDILSRMTKDRENEYREGVINLQTLLEAEKNRAGAETRLAEIEQAATKAEQGFFLLTGIRPEGLEFSTPLSEGIELPADSETLSERTVAASPEVRKLSVAAEQAELYRELERKTGQLRPDFFLRLGMDITGQRVPVVGANWTDTWDVNFLVTLGTKLTVWDSGQSAAKRKQAAVKAYLAREGLRQTIDSTKLAIDAAADSVVLAYRQVQEGEAGLLLAKEQFKNARVSYENDLLTRGELLGAETAMVQAEVELLSAELSYQHAKAELDYLTGGKALR